MGDENGWRQLAYKRSRNEWNTTYVVNVEKVGVIVALRRSLRADPVELVCKAVENRKGRGLVRQIIGR